MIRQLSFSSLVWASILIVAGGCCATQAIADEGRPPNIILIVADDLGYGELGCYGQQRIKTPNIDRIASEGIRFTQHYSGQTVCAPSRCSLLTGFHQGHAYIRDNGNPADRGKARPDELYFPGQHPIPDQTVTIAELLKSRGYATAAIGKWGLGYAGSTGDPNRQGFDQFYGYLCQVHAHNHYPQFLVRNGNEELQPGNTRELDGAVHSQDRFIAEALQFIDQHQEDPFFLYLPFAIPHLSIQAPPDVVQQYVGVIPEADYEHRGYLRHPTPRAGYAAMITHMDAGIGEILNHIDQLGVDQNTLVMFTSDNGPTYDRLGGSDSEFFDSSGPLRGRKGSLLEGGIRVPLVARWPGRIPAGTVSDHLCAFWDYLPTICDAAEIGSLANIDGLSFLPTLIGDAESQTEHDYLYWEFPGYGGQQAIRLGRWKGLRQGLHKDPLAPFQLYDLENDIGESRDVATENPEIVEQLRRIAAKSRQRSALFPFEALDNE